MAGFGAGVLDGSSNTREDSTSKIFMPVVVVVGNEKCASRFHVLDGSPNPVDKRSEGWCSITQTQRAEPPSGQAKL